MPLPSHPISIALMPADWLAIQAALRCAQSTQMNAATTLRHPDRCRAAEQNADQIKKWHDFIGQMIQECNDAATDRFLQEGPHSEAPSVQDRGRG